jgi:predicted transcriptional regulator
VTDVKKGMLFEAVAVLLLIFLVFILFIMVTGSGSSSSSEWSLSGLISNQIGNNMILGSDGTLYTVDGANIHAIDKTGQLRWSLEIPYLLNGSPVVSWTGYQAVTDNGTLYIELTPATGIDSVAELLAISPNGKLLWEKSYIAQGLPWFLDARNGELYVKYSNNVTVYNAEGQGTSLSPEDTPAGLFNESTPVYNITYSASQNVTDYIPPAPLSSGQEEIASALQRTYEQQTSGAYEQQTSVDPLQEIVNEPLDQLDPVEISADDTKTGKNLWTYTLPIVAHTVTVTESNYQDLFMGYDVSFVEKDNTMSPQQWYQLNNVTSGLEAVCNGGYETVFLQTDNMLYVSYWTYNYEVPTFFNISKCTYSGGIYALNNNGSLIWSKDTGSRVTAMQASNQANNSTIYYATSNGKIFATNVNAATGFALVSLIYLLVRFYLAGAVTRARGRIDSNKNRNQVLKFINDNPGVSLYDISKSLKINMGTVRYHLMILGINHRITSCKADEKYVRYFTNAGSYSARQQLVLSLMRRDGLYRMLSRLTETPGVTNLELATGLGMKESSTIRYLKELLANGIITKDRTSDGRQTYSINDVYKEDVEFAIKVFPGSPTSFRIQHESPQKL